MESIKTLKKGTKNRLVLRIIQRTHKTWN